MRLKLPVVDELTHPRYPLTAPVALKAEITAVSTFGRGSALSRVGCRCQIDGFAAIPRNESALLRTVNALISRTLPFPA